VLEPITMRVGKGKSTFILWKRIVNCGTTFHRISVITPPAITTTAMG
jgi:hypothetical protein